MANRDAPYGFQPVAMLDGSAIPVRRFPLLSTHIIVAVGDLVECLAGGTVDGNDLPGTVPEQQVGCIVGLYDTNGVPAGHPNSSIATKHIAASTGGFVDVALQLPGAVFRAQTSGTVAETGRFASVDTDTYVAADTTTSQSKLELGSATTGAANWLIIDKVNEPGNAWGANVQLLVVACEGFWNAALAGV